MNSVIIVKPEKILKALDKIEQNLDNAVDLALTKIAELIAAEARNTKLFKGNSSNGLRKNIKVINNGSLSKSVLADKDYAYYVEFGNNQKGPYIYPVRAKALRFIINGEVLFRKKVRSHGPTYFMRAAYENVKSDLPDTFNKVFSKEIFRK